MPYPLWYLSGSYDADKTVIGEQKSAIFWYASVLPRNLLLNPTSSFSFDWSSNSSWTEPSKLQE